MATIKFNVIAEARGSINGTTYARNRAGAYARNRSVPVNPGSPRQDVVRAAVGTLAARWRDTLTNGQREAWDVYALDTPRPNKVGDPINVGGLGMYVRGNVPRIQAGLSIVDNGPLLPGVPEVGLVSINTNAGGAFTVDYDDTLPWTNQNGGALLIYLSANKSPALNFFKGPYRFAGLVAGNATTAPTSPATVAWPFGNAPTAGNQIFLRAVVVDQSARLSNDSNDAYIAV
ncbi:MAG: hypothetical protein RIC94_14815 [Phycisphaerales bacterium]